MGDAERRPSFRDVLNALTPPGTSGSALFEALKAAQVQPAPGAVPDVTLTPEGRQRHCINCGTNHDYMAVCPSRMSALPAATGASAPAPSLPADPFSPGHVAGVGLTEMLSDMTAGGMPLASAERILGAMLAAHAIMTAALEDNRDQS